MNGRLAALRRITPAASVFGAVFMAACDGVGIGLNPSYDPLRSGISRLALTPTGWVEKLGFGVLGLCILVTASSLATSALSKTSRVFLTLSGLLALNGLGFLTISIFNTDAPHQVTTAGIIHLAGAFASSSVPTLSAIIFTPGFIRNPRLRPYVIFTLFTGLYAALGGLALLLLPEGSWFGLGLYERILMGLTLVWLGVAGTGLLRVADQSGIQTPAAG
jgi:hypothetical protein